MLPNISLIVISLLPGRPLPVDILYYQRVTYPTSQVRAQHERIRDARGAQTSCELQMSFFCVLCGVCCVCVCVYVCVRVCVCVCVTIVSTAGSEAPTR